MEITVDELSKSIEILLLLERLRAFDLRQKCEVASAETAMHLS